MDTRLERAVARAKRRFMGDLKSRYGISEDDIRVVVKPRGRGYVSMYRSRSQYDGSPLFWISGSLESAAAELGESLEDVAYDCIAHEYGHAVHEFAAAQDAGLWRLVERGWGYDEEPFAEGFVWLFRGLAGTDDKTRYAGVLRRYRALAFEGEGS